MTLREFMDQIGSSWPFDAATYPALQNLQGDGIAWQLFAIDHILHHQSKSHAVLASALERSQHGQGLYENNTNASELRSQMRIAARKMVKNSLRLAQVLGLTAEDIEQLL